MSDHHDLPLFRWTPPECQIIAFPPKNRVGKIRDVARKWLAQGTKTQADGYVRKIDGDMHRQFERLGFSEDGRKALVSGFWAEVDAEVRRLRAMQRSQRPNQPGGAA